MSETFQPKKMTNKPKAEKTEDDRRHAGQIENRDADEPDDADRSGCIRSDKWRC